MGIFSQFKEGFSGVLSITTVRNGKALTKYSLEYGPEKVPSSKRRFLVGAVPLCSPQRPIGATPTGDNLQPRFVDEEIAPTMTTEPVL